MRIVVLMALLSVWLFGGSAGEAAPQLNEKFHDSSKCKPCHARIVSEWSQSYHAKSHFDSNEYLRRSHRSSRPPA